MLVACQQCPLICCYDCAIERLTCDRATDLWPVKPPSKKLKGDKLAPGTRGEVGPGAGRMFSHRSPLGHAWGACLN